MIRETIDPEAHQPWCADRAKPFTAGHLGDGSQKCNGPDGGTSRTPVYLVENERHGADVQIGEVRYSITEATAVASAIYAVVNTLGDVA